MLPIEGLPVLTVLWLSVFIKDVSWLKQISVGKDKGAKSTYIHGWSHDTIVPGSPSCKSWAKPDMFASCPDCSYPTRHVGVFVIVGIHRDIGGIEVCGQVYVIHDLFIGQLLSRRICILTFFHCVYGCNERRPCVYRWGVRCPCSLRFLLMLWIVEN